MKIRLVTGEGDPGIWLSGILSYSESEYGFRFSAAAPTDLQRLRGDSGSASLSIQTLQIEIGVATGCLLYPRGYFPCPNWVQADLVTPAFKRGVLQSFPDRPFERGIATDIRCDGQWISTFDRELGWLRVADDGYRGKLQFIEFASDCVAGIDNDRIRELWLHPEWDRSEGSAIAEDS